MHIYDPEEEGMTGSRTGLESERHFVGSRSTAHQGGTSPLSVFDPPSIPLTGEIHQHQHHYYRISVPSLSYGMSDVTIMVPHDKRPGAPSPSRCHPGCRGLLPWRSYQRGILSSGKACALAGVKRWEWEELPGARSLALRR